MNDFIGGGGGLQFVENKDVPCHTCRCKRRGFVHVSAFLYRFSCHNGLQKSPNWGPEKGVITKGVFSLEESLASGAYRAIGGVARNSIANRTIVGH